MIVTNCLDEYFALISERPELFVESEEYPIVTKREVIEEYQKSQNIKIGVLYKSPFNILVVDLIDKKGEMFTYERIVPASKSNGVVCVPIMNGKLMLLNQQRHPIRSEQLCFPRGFGEDGIPSLENAKKELLEEIGAVANKVVYLGSIFPDSGLCSTKCDIYLCEIENYDKSAFCEGIKDLMLLDIPELEEKIKSNMITDAFTLSAFAIFKGRRVLL